MRRPILVFSDVMDNPGACGEAGQSMIRLKTKYFRESDWGEVTRILRHEIAHIVVNNTPEWRDVPSHGREFEATLKRVDQVMSPYPFRISVRPKDTCQPLKSKRSKEPLPSAFQSALHSIPSNSLDSSLTRRVLCGMLFILIISAMGLSILAAARPDTVIGWLQSTFL